MITADDINKLVRIKPINAQRHWMRGKLVGLEKQGRVAVVFFFTHKHTEKIKANRVKLWAGKQHIWEQQA